MEEAASQLMGIVSMKKLVKLSNGVKFAALFSKPQRFIAGGCSTGFGGYVVHFLGMAALIPLSFKIE